VCYPDNMFCVLAPDIFVQDVQPVAVQPVAVQPVAVVQPVPVLLVFLSSFVSSFFFLPLFFLFFSSSSSLLFLSSLSLSLFSLLFLHSTLFFFRVAATVVITRNLCSIYVCSTHITIESIENKKRKKKFGLLEVSTDVKTLSLLSSLSLSLSLSLSRSIERERESSKSVLYMYCEM